MRLRPLAPSDDELLRIATLGNLNWCGERFTMDDVEKRPEFAHYTVIDSARGDFGVVAELDASPVGVCWAQFFPDQTRGYGFVDDSTPELSVWVAPEVRRRGIGRRLLNALILEAKSRGLTRMSLSVEQGNVANNLYRSLGFEEVSGRENDGVMMLSMA